MIIFLDIDGVIATRESYKIELDSLNRECIIALNILSIYLQAKIVVSSAWRSMGLKNIQRILTRAGMTASIIGITEKGWDNIRGKQIKNWVDEHDIKEYLVLDDECYYDIYEDSKTCEKLIPKKNCIQIDKGFMNKGLTMDIVNKYLKRRIRCEKSR